MRNIISIFKFAAKYNKRKTLNSISDASQTFFLGFTETTIEANK